MLFKDIVGQEELKKQLTETARKGTVAHAQLFCGQPGANTFPLALAYARYLNCTDRSETDACGKCKSYLQYNELAHPDLHFVFRGAGAGAAGEPGPGAPDPGERPGRRDSLAPASRRA